MSYPPPIELFISGFNDVTVSPYDEIPITTISSREFAIRYLYSRSSESQNANVVGQDTLKFRYSDNKIVFALCDGVGQSFNGQLASQFIGNRLVNWLWDFPETEFLERKVFSTKIQEYLNRLTKDATNIVEEYSIPDNSPKVVKNVLEEMRFLGSETTFVCGCIILPNSYFPNGGIAISWLGDTEFRLWNKNGELINLSIEFISGEHWSTSEGLRKKIPHIWIDDLANIERLAVFSDGLLPIKDIIEQIEDEKIINYNVQAIAKSGESDDLCFLEIKIEHREIQDIQETTSISVDQPISCYIKVIPDGIEIHWLSSRGASGYIVKYEIDGVMIENGKYVSETYYKIKRKKWNTLKFGIQTKAGDRLSKNAFFQFSKNNSDEFKLLVTIIIIALTSIISYLLGQGK
jgi:hypothetical protein